MAVASVSPGRNHASSPSELCLLPFQHPAVRHDPLAIKIMFKQCAVQLSYLARLGEISFKSNLPPSTVASKQLAAVVG